MSELRPQCASHLPFGRRGTANGSSGNGEIVCQALLGKSNSLAATSIKLTAPLQLSVAANAVLDGATMLASTTKFKVVTRQ